MQAAVTSTLSTQELVLKTQYLAMPWVVDYRDERRGGESIVDPQCITDLMLAVYN